MISTPCPLCNGTTYRLYIEKAYALGERTFDLVRCRGCGLVRVEPMPGIEEVRGLYTKNYFDRDFSCGVRKGTYLESEAMRVREYRETLENIEKFKHAGRLLEVGCAAGSFLNYARRSGWEAEGADVSEWAAQAAGEQFGVKVHVGRLVEIGFPDKSFDVVFMGDLLEHEPEPLELMKECRRVLKKDGLLAVKVPTYVNSLFFRVARRVPVSWIIGRMDMRLLQAMKLVHQNPKSPPYHLYEYSRGTLTRLCRKAGLKVQGHKTSILVPEFLDRWNATPLDRLMLGGFLMLRELVVRFNLPAGHVMVFAEKG